MPINMFARLIGRRRHQSTYPDWLACEPALLPPPELMRTEGITILEEWLRWGKEWSVLLRVYGHLQSDAHVMEIGCGLGRIAFPLRYAGRHRPHGFARPDFDFDHEYEDYGSNFAVVVPDNPEQMTAYRLEFLRRMAESAGLRLEGAPIPGLWSGSSERWVGAQDLIILVKA